MTEHLNDSWSNDSHDMTTLPQKKKIQKFKNESVKSDNVLSPNKTDGKYILFNFIDNNINNNLFCIN